MKNFNNLGAWFYKAVMRPKDAEGKTNSEDSDQTAAIKSSSVLFALNCLSLWCLR